MVDKVCHPECECHNKATRNYNLLGVSFYGESWHFPFQAHHPYDMRQCATHDDVNKQVIGRRPIGKHTDIYRQAQQHHGFHEKEISLDVTRRLHDGCYRVVHHLTNGVNDEQPAINHHILCVGAKPKRQYCSHLCYYRNGNGCKQV